MIWKVTKTFKNSCENVVVIGVAVGTSCCCRVVVTVVVIVVVVTVVVILVVEIDYIVVICSRSIW